MRALALTLLALLSTSAVAAPAFVRAKGVFKIDDAGKSTLVTPDKDLPTELTVDRDGDVWVASISGKVVAHKKKKRTVQLPGKPGDTRYPVAMVAAKDGGIWALGREQLFRITADGKLTRHALFVDRLLGPASILEVGDVVWVASENGIHQLTAKKWMAARTERHEFLVRDSAGTVWSVMQGKDKPHTLVGFDGLKWIEGPVNGGGVSALAVGKEGRVYVGVFGKNAGLYAFTSKAGQSSMTKKSEVADVAELVVDGSERVWARSSNTVRVFDKDVKPLAEFGPGAIDGVQGNVLDIDVAGAGPTTLPKSHDPFLVIVSGRFMKSAKEPLANQRIKFCAAGCAASDTTKMIETKADGTFEADLMAIEYRSIQIDNTVHSITNFNAGKAACCLQGTKGKPIDLGTLRAP